MEYFRDKIVWITGASSGIGEALAHAFAQSGAKLILSARRQPELERVKKDLNLPESHVYILPLNLENTETFSQKAAEAMQVYQSLDILVHNGGISQRAFVKDTDLTLDRKIMEVNYFGAVGLTKAVLPYMLQQQHGHFVVTSSLVGKFGTPMRSAYAASKHALHGFFESLRAEVWRDHIGVTLVCPGYIRTNISFNALTGTGNKHNQMDENQEKGMSPEKCAMLILKAIAAHKEEVLIGGRETAGVYLKRFFPGLFSRFIRKLKVS